MGEFRGQIYKMCLEFIHCKISGKLLSLDFFMHIEIMGFPSDSAVKNLPVMQETQVRSLGWENPLREHMATHSSILAWRIPWTEEPGGLQSLGLHRVRHDWSNWAHQFSSVAQSCPTLCDPMDCSPPGFPVHHQTTELAQTHVHRVGDDIQPSHPLLSPSPRALNLSQHQGLFKWVSSSHQVAKALEFQLQHQSFQWIFRTDFL